MRSHNKALCCHSPGRMMLSALFLTMFSLQVPDLLLSWEGIHSCMRSSRGGLQTSRGQRTVCCSPQALQPM